jgi:hypothetical protein
MSADLICLPTAEPRKSNAWEESVKSALKDRPAYGVLIYVTDAGETVYISIGVDRVALRGLIEEILDDLRGM